MSNFKKIIFSILATVLFFGLGEMILTAIGFRYSNTPLLIQRTINFNNQDGIIRFRKDPVQFWVPSKSFENTTPLKKPSHVKRIATLGDSCTQGCVADAGEWTWNNPYAFPDFLRDLLKTDMKGADIEVLNAAVGSYSSFQGLKRLEHTVLKFSPDLLTIYFGWNDHWIGKQEDKNIFPSNRSQVVFYNIMENSRFFQWIHYLVAKMTKKTSEDLTNKKKDYKWRVTLSDYEKNLNAMIDLAQERGMPVILITAPQNIKDWEPWDIFPSSKENLLEVHRKYNDVVRITAERRNVHLLDLEKIMQQEPSDKLMSKDGIHFTSKGCYFVAKMLARKILDEKLLSP